MGEKVKKLKKWQKIVIVVLAIVLVVVGGFFVFRKQIARAILNDDQWALLNIYYDSQKILEYSDYNYNIYKLIGVKSYYADSTSFNNYSYVYYQSQESACIFSQYYSTNPFFKNSTECRTNDDTLYLKCNITNKDFYEDDEGYFGSANASKKIVKFETFDDVDNSNNICKSYYKEQLNTLSQYQNDTDRIDFPEEDSYTRLNIEIIELPSYILFLFG
ncbi:hypothetical protein [uncultured Ruminococcus sp.]|uniref:hypothetical protein n=1 Tax=uncultured Ruminococcus sp. TaxID=165186 RepID=UPI0025EA862A|nr:hypothetical protein [uncultured Ruminococcus sp.]